METIKISTTRKWLNKWGTFYFSFSATYSKDEFQKLSQFQSDIEFLMYPPPPQDPTWSNSKSWVNFKRVWHTQKKDQNLEKVIFAPCLNIFNSTNLVVLCTSELGKVLVTKKVSYCLSWDMGIRERSPKTY